jgi:eukaryotic-like serine/threonine-protein kinase
MKSIVIAVCLLLAPAEIFAQAMFHGNLAHSGVYAGAGPSEFHNVKWAFKSGGPIVGSPVAAGGVVFVGSTDNLLYAIDEQSGKQKWTFRTLGGRQISSTPAVVDGVVYFLGFDAVFYAVSAETGKQKWTFITEYERRFQANRLHGYSPGYQTIPDSWDLLSSSPAVTNGKVYFGSGDGNVYALDAQTGALAWKFPTGDVVHASPAVVNGVVYIGSWDSFFYAIDAETGQEKWRFKGGEDCFIHNQQGFQSSAAVVDGVVYVGCRDGHLYAVDAATGRKKWDYPTSKGWVNSTPAVRDGLVYAGTSDGYRFFALDAKTGRLRFNFDAKGAVFSSPALAAALVYFGSTNGKLYAVDAKTGELAWQFQTESAKNDPLKILKPDGGINNDAVYTPYFRDYQDMVLAFYRIFSVGAIWSSPAVDNGVVFFGSTDGNLYAIQ